MVDFITKNRFKGILVIILKKGWLYNEKGDEVFNTIK